MADQGFVNVADDLDPAVWLSSTEIEAVIVRARGGAEVWMRSGAAYQTRQSAKHILNLLVNANGAG